MLGRDSLHVCRLLNRILLHQLLDIHLEAFAVANVITILGKDYDEARVDPFISIFVGLFCTISRRFLGALDDRSEGLREDGHRVGGSWLHRMLPFLNVVESNAK